MNRTLTISASILFVIIGTLLLTFTDIPILLGWAGILFFGFCALVEVYYFLSGKDLDGYWVTFDKNNIHTRYKGCDDGEHFELNHNIKWDHIREIFITVDSARYSKIPCWVLSAGNKEEVLYFPYNAHGNKQIINELSERLTDFNKSKAQIIINDALKISNGEFQVWHSKQ